MTRIVAKTCFGIFVMLSAMLFFVEPAKATSAIYIHADGTIAPAGVPISTVDFFTYTLTGTLYDSVVVERSNIIVDGAGFTVQGFELGEGFRLYEVSNVTMKRMKIRGFTYGIYLDKTNDSLILENDIAASVFDGIELHDCSNNFISRNNISTNEWYGIGFYYSTNNTVVGNNIVNNYNGVRLYYSSHNRICENDLADNFAGTAFHNSSDNLIFHNNFTNEAHQVYSESSVNLWNENYPYGGNYWSDYDGEDLLKGPLQDTIGGDGVGDTPYVINENNQDKYPLTKPYVRWPSDVNGDRMVNILDITIAGLAYGSHPGHERWNRATDIDGNDVINIVDLALVAKDFGKAI